MPEISDSKYLVTAGWRDVPHLDEKTQRELLASTPPYQRDARSKGTPSLGAGAIYPIEEDRIKVQPFPIPAFWKKAYSLDVGWNRTAALWGAEDPATGTCYLYSEYYAGQAVPSTHAVAIRARGGWVPGVVDPASRGRSQVDGTVLLDTYRELGLTLTAADNAVEAGLYDVWQMLESGRLKIFSSLLNWFGEYRLYRRDENGKIIKKNDHLMDCLTGDTLVMTMDGAVPISAMPKTGWVLTEGGGWSRYDCCQQYGSDRPITQVRFEDGSSVRCTPDHLFWTDHGWIKAIDLVGMLCDTYDVSQAVDGENQCGLPSSRRPSKSLMASDIICADDTFSATDGACILPSGQSITEEDPQGAITSIIPTKTAQTTSLKILCYLSMASICRIIMRVSLKQWLRSLWSALRSGMVQKPEKNGIASITPASRTSCIGRQNDLAINAGSGTRHLIAAESGSAPTLADPRRALRLESITSSDNAPFVEPRSPLIAISPNAPARLLAPLRCVSVEPAGRADVYCLTVPFTSSFVLGNGVLTHNCTRYYIRSGRQVAKVKPVPREVSVARGTGDDRMGY